MYSTYIICKKQIENDKKKGTHKVTLEVLNIFLVNNSLTIEEYEELVAMLGVEEKKDAE